jgi:uncharacterized iron-regulated membrane protein
MVSRAREALPQGQPTNLTLSAHPTAAALISFGREQVVFVDPYTGSVLVEGATLRSFFRVVTDWHRWLGTEGESREIGRAITGACNAVFVVLVISGFYLWWPRRWTLGALKAATVPRLRLRGKPRDWNWHNAVGFWSAPALLCIALTGMVMSYQWANNMIYTLTGSEPPSIPQRPVARPIGGPSEERRGRAGVGGESDPTPVPAGLDAMFATAVQQAPDWRLMHIRLPQPGAGHMTVMIEEATSLHPYPRSTLTLDVATATVVKWEPFANYALGRTIRSWVRPVHTGEAGGPIGQSIAALGSAGGAVMVYTGVAQAWRRLWQFVRRHQMNQGVARKKEDQGVARRHAS